MSYEVIRYSEAFKLQVVGELESGKLLSQGEAKERYGIGGAATISRWCKRYGKNELLGKVVRVERVEERDQVREYQDKIRQLEGALADAKIHELLYRGYFEALCREQGLDSEAVKKNIAPKR
jgi:transposase